MFEDSTFESSNRIKKTNWWIVATFALNVSILIVMILIPLLSPESLPKAAMAMMLTAPPPPPPPPPPPAPEVHQVIVKPQMMNNQLTAPTKIPKDIKMVTEKEAPPSSFGVAGMEGMGSGAAGGVIGSVFGNATPQPQVKMATPKKIAISQGVAAGLLVSEVKPVYPPIAKAARQSGTVVLHALISKTGTIEDLKVISGNAMLQSAALDAVRQWRYRPYMLNGEPVEVDTTINVVFNLGGG